jgi:hypothetical protein
MAQLLLKKLKLQCVSVLRFGQVLPSEKNTFQPTSGRQNKQKPFVAAKESERYVNRILRKMVVA